MKKMLNNFIHHDIDIRNSEAIEDLFKKNGYDVIIHCVAQPPHDKAKDIPLIDFSVNAAGTLNLLEATRRFNPEGIFIYMNTNKVYGDVPNSQKVWHLHRYSEYNNVSN